jgi:hypothetical protein
VLGKLDRGIHKKNDGRYEGLHELRSNHIMEILHRHYPLEKTIRRALKNCPEEGVAIVIANLTKHSQAQDLPEDFWEEYFRKIGLGGNVNAVAFLINNKAIGFAKKHKNIFNKFSTYVASHLNKKKEISELLKYVELECFSLEPNLYSDMYLFLERLYAGLDKRWLVDFIRGCSNLEILGTLTTYFSAVSDVGDNYGELKDAASAACEALIENCPPKTTLSDMESLFDGLFFFDRDLADYMARELSEEVLPKLLNEEKDFFSIRYFITSTMEFMGPEFQSYLLASIDKDHFLARARAARNFFDQEDIDSIGELNPLLADEVQEIVGEIPDEEEEDETEWEDDGDIPF